MTPIQYAKSQFAADKFADMTIQHIAGAYYLGDTNWNLLKGKAYATVEAARQARSKALDRAAKFIA